MITFQVFGLLVLAVLVVLTLAGSARGLFGRRTSLVWLAAWVAAAVALVWPGATAFIARTLGVGRGADLVFYCAILAGLVGFFLVYLRLRRIESQITTIVRHLTIEAAEGDAGAGVGSGGDDEPGDAR